MVSPGNQTAPVKPQATRWWTWAFLVTSIWVCPAGMLIVFGCCYTEVFGEPPCGPWAEWTIDGLFLLDLGAITIVIYCSMDNPWRLLLAVLMSGIELVVTAYIWFFGSISVSGFYF